ncbi:MAG: D-alanyl-D-alanine dipeptidase [Alphaproteobacteria bacterium]
MLTAVEAGDGVAVDLRYATRDNVLGRPLYRRAACLLNPEAAQALARAAEIVRPLGLRLRIYDAFRPIEAQLALLRRFPGSPYVSDPRTGSAPHCRGAAVDLGLDDAAGAPLNMGTPFDDFTPAAHHGTTAVSPEAQRNRAILLGVMTAAGWDFYRREWWHYQLFQPRRFPLLSDSVLPEPMIAEDL